MNCYYSVSKTARNKVYVVLYFRLRKMAMLLARNDIKAGREYE